MKYKILAAILSVIAGVGLYQNFHEPPKDETPEPAPKKISEPKPIQGYGVIDLERIKSAHPEGENLAELESREKRLRLELDALLIPYQKPKEDKPPEIDKKPFDESAREKNMQNLISQLAELKAKRTQLTEQYTKESRAEYIRRRDEVHSVYLNRALNITLKLQNADNLRLTEEQINQLQAELDELIIERNKKQGEMLAQWTAEINERVEKEIAPEESRIKREAEDNLKKMQEESAQKIRETEERNKNLMETATHEIEARQNRRKEILSELDEVAKNRTELENKILDSIVEKVAMLGKAYRLEMIFVKSDKIKIYTGKNTQDLTGELLKE